MAGSPKLKAAMAEIGKILEKHDIAGAVFLADGLGMGEFGIFVDKPSWSQLRFIQRPDGSSAVHTKLYTKSRPQETERTVNALYVTMDMMGRTFLMFKGIADDFETKVRIEKEPGAVIPHREP